jgi:hypothetical protein
MDFPPDWKVDDMEDFDVAVATLAESDDAVAVELLAQLRPNGRVLDNFRFAVNSSQILDVELSFNNLLPAEPLRDYKLRYQYWARDIAIRRNLTTSGWIDVADLVAANNATVLDPASPTPSSSRSWASCRMRDRRRVLSAGRWSPGRTLSSSSSSRPSRATPLASTADLSPKGKHIH